MVNIIVFADDIEFTAEEAAEGLIVEGVRHPFPLSVTEVSFPAVDVPKLVLKVKHWFLGVREISVFYDVAPSTPTGRWYEWDAESGKGIWRDAGADTTAHMRREYTFLGGKEEQRD